MHGQDAAGDELSVLPDGKVPRLDPHQIIKGKLQYQTTLCTNLDKDHIVSFTFLLLISVSLIFNRLAGGRQLIWTQTKQKSVFIGQA